MATAISSWRTVFQDEMAWADDTGLIDRAALYALRDFCKTTRLWFEQLPAIEILANIREYPVTRSSADILGLRSVKIDDTGVNYECAMDQRRYLVLPFTPSDDADYCSALTDLTFTSSTTNTIVSAATNFATAGVSAGDVLCVSGCAQTRNNRQYEVTAIGDDGAGTNNKLTVTENVVDYGAGAGTATISLGGLVVWVDLCPVLTATTVEDFLWNDHAETILFGIKWKLYEMPGKAWTDYDLSAYFKRAYEKERDSLKPIVSGTGGYGNVVTRVKLRRFV